MPDQQVDGVPGNGDAIYNYLTAQQGQGFIYIEDRPVVTAGAMGINRQGEHVVADGRGGWVRGCPCAACRNQRGYNANVQARAAQVRITTEQMRVRDEQLTAGDKARQLAFTFLTDQQRASVETSGHFEVISNKGNRWKIHTRYGTSGNVYRLGKMGQVKSSWCGYPHDNGHGSLPAWDVFLGQAFALETDEDYFTGVAIGSGGYGEDLPF